MSVTFSLINMREQTTLVLEPARIVVTLKLHSHKAAKCPTWGEGKAMGRAADLHIFLCEN